MTDEREQLEVGFMLIKHEYKKPSVLLWTHHDWMQIQGIACSEHSPGKVYVEIMTMGYGTLETGTTLN